MTNHTLEGADKIRRVSSGVIVGRTTAGEGRAELLTPSAARSLLAVQTAGEVAALYYNKTEVDSLLTAKANASHGHIISDISGLSSTLSGIQGDIVTLATTTVPRTTTLTINGTAQDLSANRSWTVGDVRSDASYSNPTWLTGLAWSKVSGTPVTLAGYGITDAVPVARTIATGTGLAGGGNLGSDRTISLANTTVSPGSYTLANITVDAQGRITAASNGSASGGITSLGGQTGTTQTLQTGTSGTDFQIVSSANVHTFNLPDASPTARGLVTTGTQTFAGQKAFAQGTLTSSAPLTLTQTWNNVATTFTGLLVNVTNTASATASLLADVQVGGTSVFQVARDGAVRIGSATRALTPLSSSGLYYHAGTIGTSGRSWYADVQRLQMCSDGYFGFSSTTDSAITADVRLYRDAAGVLALLNGTNAQTFRVYNTWASTTNAEWYQESWVSNEIRLGTAVGSVGGTQRSTVIGSWNAAGTFSPFLTITNTGQATFSGVTIHSQGFYSGSGNVIEANGLGIGVNQFGYFAFAGTNDASTSKTLRLTQQSAGVLQIGTAAALAGGSLLCAGATIQTTGAVASLVISNTSSNNPTIDVRGTNAVSDFTAVGFGPNVTTTTSGRFAQNAVADGGFAVLGFTSSTASATPLYFAGHSGSTAPTAPVMRFDAWKWNGTTGRQALSAAETVAAFNNGSTSVVSFTGGGAIVVSPAPDQNTPSIRSNDTCGFGFRGNANNMISVIANSSIMAGIYTNTFALASGSALAWSATASGTNWITTADLFLVRDAANSLGIRNGTNAQTVGIYNTWAAANNFEELQFQWSTNVARVGTAVGSVGGTQRAMSLGCWNAAGAFTTALTVNTTGTVTIGAYTLPATDGTNGQVLQTNGTGAVSWATVSGGGGGGTPGGSNTQIQFNDAGAFGGSASLTLDKTTGQLTNAQGTLTASAPLTLTQTWNNVATTFTGLSVAVTDTASAAGSLITNMTVGGTTMCSIAKDGTMAVHPGSGGPWRYTFVGQGTTGLAYFGTGLLIGHQGSYCSFGANRFTLPGGCALAWISGGDTSVVNPEFGLNRDAAHTLTQRGNTASQTFNLSNTWTSATNFEYGRFQWNTNQFRVGTAVGSAGGTGRQTVLGWWDSAGAFLPLITLAGSGSRTVTHTARVNGINAADVVFSADGSNIGAGFTLLNNNGTIWNVFSAGNSTVYNDHLSLLCNNSYRFVMSSLGNQQWFQGASTSGSPTLLTATGAAHTGLTASTEATDINFNLARTVTFSVGALTTQRAFRIQAPTYSCPSAMAITTASTVSISGAPAAAGLLTITNPYALNVESGISNFNGRVFITDGSSVIESANWAGGSLLVTFGGNRTFAVGGNGIRMALGYPITFCSDASLNNPDVFLYRDAANTLALRNATNAQTFRLYNTFTSATNHEFLKIAWTTNVAEIGTVKGSGGGSARDLVLQTDGVTRMTFGAAGTATVNTALVAGSTALINAGSQAFTTGFHVVSWNEGCIGWASTGTVTTASTADTAIKRASAGLVEINNGTAGTYRDLVVRNLRMSAPTVPATATSTGSEGQISWDSNFVYVCVATSSWKRAALSSW